VSPSSDSSSSSGVGSRGGGFDFFGFSAAFLRFGSTLTAAAFFDGFDVLRCGGWGSGFAGVGVSN
jgi:hypothetical protein